MQCRTTKFTFMFLFELQYVTACARTACMENSSIIICHLFFCCADKQSQIVFIVLFLETTNAVREPTWDEIRDHNVIITTLVTARMLWKFYQDGRLRFTHILIDEAAQALEPKCMIPLVMADENTKIVLAGDHKQVISRD